MNKRKLLLNISILLTITVIVIISYTHPPSQSKIYLPCVFRTLSGYLCPICGSSRSLHSFVHGDIAEAFRCNFLLVLSIFYFSILFVLLSIQRVTGRPNVFKLTYKYGYYFSVIIILFGIFRNIPNRIIITEK